eukprot:CAMPEP_0171981636 /NCGR_PEP_ID=MMETSP0993-20121228/267258_1 /TAXON_ID=483369 /ORGANISM="non described non described, Strain CCMP2098" /LENGTH=44 /DNA_ID= /DNA_START= /DNA_END= /DNA_ORIENTATION=
MRPPFVLALRETAGGVHEARWGGVKGVGAEPPEAVEKQVLLHLH